MRQRQLQVRSGLHLCQRLLVSFPEPCYVFDAVGLLVVIPSCPCLRYSFAWLLFWEVGFLFVSGLLCAWSVRSLGISVVFDMREK